MQNVNDEMSDLDIEGAGVTKGSVLYPLLFLVHINDITDNLNDLVRRFAS